MTRSVGKMDTTNPSPDGATNMGAASARRCLAPTSPQDQARHDEAEIQSRRGLAPRVLLGLALYRVGRAGHASRARPKPHSEAAPRSASVLPNPRSAAVSTNRYLLGPCTDHAARAGR